MTIRLGCNLLVSETDATTLAAAYQRAVKAHTSGRIESTWADDMGRRTFWLVQSTTRPEEHHLVKVEERADGRLLCWCECAYGPQRYCKHIAYALNQMGLLPCHQP